MKQSNSKSKHCLYLLRISRYVNVDGSIVEEDVALKVGISNNVSRRLLEIQSGTPFKVTPIRVLEGTKDEAWFCERKIKQMCKGYKLSERLFKSGYSETMDVRYLDWLLALYDRLVGNGLVEIEVV